MAVDFESISIKGFNETQKQLAKLRDEIPAKTVGKALRAGANVIKKAMRARAPVSLDGSHGRKRGFLRRNIAYKTVERKGQIQTVSVGPQKAAFYGGMIERGTSKLAARPFMRPALDESREAAVQAVSVVIGEDLEILVSGGSVSDAPA